MCEGEVASGPGPGRKAREVPGGEGVQPQAPAGPFARLALLTGVRGSKPTVVRDGP